MSANATEPMQQEGYDFMAAAFEVYNELGHGFTEEIYQETLENELTSRNIPFVAHPEVTVLYKGHSLKKKLRPDLLVSGEIIVELKAVSALIAEHAAQLLNYLKASGKLSGIWSTLAVPMNSNGNDLRGQGRCPNPSASISGD